MLKQNEAVLIDCAGNGFIVRRADRNQMMAHDPSDALVFQTMEELVAFMQHHFTHRAEFVKTDLCGRLDD